MSVPIAEPHRAILDNRRAGSPLGGLVRAPAGRIYLWLIAGALGLAALSLLLPSTPSYDPWAWIVWGRQILHGTLHTPGGPTWKPLPVLFTTVFALFGRAEPDLWLVVARAGAVVAVVMTAKLAARLTWWLRDRSGAQTHGDDPVAMLAPAALAAAVAVTAMVLYGNLVSDSALGYSEGLASASILVAIERHIDGHHRQAFLCGLIAALDRPEIWLFWGSYGVWLMWRDPGSRGLILGTAIVCVFLWFAPQKWGGGSFISGITRARHPQSSRPAFASCPFCTELGDHAWPLVLQRVNVAALALIAAAALWLRRAWRSGTAGGTEGERTRAVGMLALSALFGFGWWVLIAVETQLGFSGNDRYLVIGCAFIELAAGGALGWAAIALANAISRSRRSSGAQPRAYALMIGTGLSAMVFVLAPNWVGANLDSVPAIHRALVHEAHLHRDVARLTAGGARARLLGCGDGTLMASGLEVPMIAWYLNVRFLRVHDPHTSHGIPIPDRPWPNVIFQARDTNTSEPVPDPRTIRAWQHVGARYTSVQASTVRLFTDCRRR